jgi:hypothetical protein
LVPSANLATSSTAAGDITTGDHYTLLALFDIGEIEAIIAKNISVECKVALAVAKNPGVLNMGTACVANSGCTVQHISSNSMKIFLHTCL